MKQPRKPNRTEKILMATQGLDPKEWLVILHITNAVMIIHKDTEEKRTIWL